MIISGYVTDLTWADVFFPQKNLHFGDFPAMFPKIQGGIYSTWSLLRFLVRIDAGVYGYV